MRADQYYKFGQALGGLASKMFGADEPEVLKEEPQQEESLPQSTSYDRKAAKSIVDQYIQAGYDPRFAVGMAANAFFESSLNPTAYNKKEDAFGLFQHRADRLDNLRTFVDRQGKDINDLSSHVAFSIQELAGAERVAYGRILKDDPKAAEDYARLIDKHYERSDGKSRDQRANLAGQMYKDMFGEVDQSREPQSVLAKADQGMSALGEYAMAFNPANQPNAGQDAISSHLLASAPTDGNGVPRPTAAAPSQEQGTPSLVGAAKGAYEGVTGFMQDQLGGDQGAIGTSNPPPGDRGMPDERTANEVLPFEQAPTSPEVRRMRERSEAERVRLYEQYGAQGNAEADRVGAARSMFLGASSGFHALSTGQRADWTTPVQQSLDERQRRFDRQMGLSEADRQQANVIQANDLSYTGSVQEQRNFDRTEQRLDQQLTLAENAQDFNQAQEARKLKEELNQRRVLSKIATEAGLTAEAEMIASGAPIGADLLKEKMKAVTDVNAFTISNESRKAAADRMRTLGRDDLAGVLEDPKASQHALEIAYKGALDIVPDGDTLVPLTEYSEKNLTMLKRAIPDYVPPEERASLEALAETAVRLSKPTLFDDFGKALSEAIERKTPGMKSAETRIDADDAEYAKASSGHQALINASHNAMRMAVIPNAHTGALTSDFLVPFRRYVSDILGSEAAEKVTSINDVSQVANTMYEAIRNGQLGNLAKGIVGALSDLEGEKLLSSLASGRLGRVEIMALSQLMRKGIMQQKAAAAARSAYLESLPHMRAFNTEDYEEVMQKAASKDDFETFRNLASEGDRLAAASEILKAKGVKETDNLSIKLTPEELGEVVTVVKENGDIEFVPLFKEYFPEYRK